MTTCATDNDNLCYLQWQLVLLSMTTCASQNDNLCPWQWQLALLTVTTCATDNYNLLPLTMTTCATDNDNLCYLQWQLMLLTLTTFASDNDNLFYWQWQLVPLTACYRACTCHDNLDSLKVHNTTVCEVPLKPKNIYLQIFSVYENKSLIDARTFQRSKFPISFFFSTNWM